MIAPLRCQSCGVPIRKKPKAKTPKYCVPCRLHQQEQYRKGQPRPQKII